MWRQLSMNYVRYSQIAASATRKCLKSSSKNEVDRSGKSTAKVIAWEDGKPMGDNFLNILTDITMNSDFDEETWLLEPPKIPSHSNDVQQSGRIVEWLEGAAMNIDYETRSALSRRLTSLAARKKKTAEDLREVEGSVTLQASLQRLSRMHEESAGRLQEKGLNAEVVESRLSGDTDLAVGNRSLIQLYRHECAEAIVESPHSIGLNGDDGSVDNDNGYADGNDEFYDASADFSDSLSYRSSEMVSTTVLSNDSCARTVENQSFTGRSKCSGPPALTYKSFDPSAGNGSGFEGRRGKQANTSRVSPVVMQNVTLQEPNRSGISVSSFIVEKRHLLTPVPDLNDITCIVERQEAELREEMSRMKSSVQNDRRNDVANITRSSQVHKSHVQLTKSTTSTLASSRSVEFSAKSTPTAPSISRISQLPTPVRKPMGRSLIPVLRNPVLTRSKLRAIRNLAGGSTPSLVARSQQRSAEETRSECGAITGNSNRWADECF